MNKGSLLFVAVLVIGIFLLARHHRQASSETMNSQTEESQFVKDKNVTSTSLTKQSPSALSTAAKEAPSSSSSAKIQGEEAAMKQLEKMAKGPVKVNKNPQGKPFRLSGNFPLEIKTGENKEAAIFRFLQAAAPAMFFDHPEQLMADGVVAGAEIFLQKYNGVPVEGAQVRVFTDEQGNVFLVNSSYIPGVANINTTATVTKEEASSLVYQDALRFEQTAGKTPSLSEPTLVIYKFKESPIDLAWKIPVQQPYLGPAHGSSIYYVNAHNRVFERIEKAIE